MKYEHREDLSLLNYVNMSNEVVRLILASIVNNGLVHVKIIQNYTKVLIIGLFFNTFSLRALGFSRHNKQ